MQEEALKKEVAKWDKAMEISTSKAAEKSKQQDRIIKEIKASALEILEKAKTEKSRADEAEQAVNVLKKSLEMAKTDEKDSKMALDGLCKDKLDLQGKVDTLEAELKMVKDLHAKELEDAKEEAIDNAWYRMWSTNSEVLDLDFMGEELDPALARCNTRLE